ncbi:MAG: ABC transporter ATP-binding protein [Eubacteriales bacterium]
MIKIFKHLKYKEWIFAFISLIFIVTQVWLDLKLPDYMSEITMLIQTPGSTVGQILNSGEYMLLCALGSVVSAIVVGFFAARIAASFAKRIRALLFGKVESFSMTEINRFSIASLITRSTNDVTQVQMIISMGLQVIIKAPILAVWAILKISGKSWQWTALTAAAIAFLMIMVTIIMLFAVPKFKIIQKLTDNLNGVTRENLTGIRVVRAYNAEDYQEAKFEKANSELINTNLFTSRIMAIIMPGMSMIMSGISLGVYWIGAYLIDRAAMLDKMGLFSDMVVFSAYAMQILMAFMMMTFIFIMLPRASVAAGRINEVLETGASILDGKIKASDSSVKGEVEFRNVYFKYPGALEYVLEDISFTAHNGETVAFIGSTGSGKSTLINLIPRFYDVTEGEVLVDGINVKDYTQKELHNKIGYVPQKAVLFSGTVSSNVSYGDNGITRQYSPDDIKNAVEIAQGKDFVESMENQYESSVAQGGTNVSGGQKQRLAIARAIFRNPEIYIFDDSFSALDYKTDRQLRSVLKKETIKKTSLIVAQRIGTIIDADKIIVLDNGKIVGAGMHDNLLKTCAVYQEIAYSQLSKEELKDA